MRYLVPAALAIELLGASYRGQLRGMTLAVKATVDAADAEMESAARALQPLMDRMLSAAMRFSMHSDHSLRNVALGLQDEVLEYIRMLLIGERGIKDQEKRVDAATKQFRKELERATRISPNAIA